MPVSQKAMQRKYSPVKRKANSSLSADAVRSISYEYHLVFDAFRISEKFVVAVSDEVDISVQHGTCEEKNIAPPW